MKTYRLQTTGNNAYDVQSFIDEAVADSGVGSGIVVASVPHTTAGLSIISFWDPLGLEDVMDEIARIVPARIDFKHEHDTPQDAAGHVKSAMVGATISLIIDEGKVVLGSSQHVYFLEFDGPRARKLHVHVVGA